MTHANAPLTVEGRRRLIERCRTRPIAHVAAEMGISRATASKWVNRYEQFGELGLLDRSSTPRRQPTATASPTVTRIEEMRRTRKWSAARIEFELAREGATVSRRTISRILVQLSLNRRRFIDPTGVTNREPQRIIARRPGHMVHIDVKKVGRIPDGGGWRIHGRDSPQARAVGRTKQRLRDVVVALAMQDTDCIAGMLADEVRWTLVGDRILTGHDAIRKWITALPAGDEVIFGSLVTHGREASVDGLLRVGDRGEFGFCHVLRFTGAAKTAKILRVNSYVISTPAES